MNLEVDGIAALAWNGAKSGPAEEGPELDDFVGVKARTSRRHLLLL